MIRSRLTIDFYGLQFYFIYWFLLMFQLDIPRRLHDISHIVLVKLNSSRSTSVPTLFVSLIVFIFLLGHHFLAFIFAWTCCTCFCVSASFCWIWTHLHPSILWRMAEFYSFFWLKMLHYIMYNIYIPCAHVYAHIFRRAQGNSVG